jgi:hypothetical protein
MLVIVHSVGREEISHALRKTAAAKKDDDEGVRR